MMDESKWETFNIDPIVRIIGDLKDFFMNEDNNVTKFEFIKSNIINSLHKFLCSPPQGNDDLIGRVMIARICVFVANFTENDSAPLERLIKVLESNVEQSLILPQTSSIQDVNFVLNDLKKFMRRTRITLRYDPDIVDKIRHVEDLEKNSFEITKVSNKKSSNKRKKLESFG